MELFSQNKFNNYLSTLPNYWNLGAGAEIGFYNKLIGPQWHAVNSQEMLEMSLEVIDSKKQIVFKRDSTECWWMTGFNPNNHTLSNDLLAIGTVTFPNYSMLNAFKESLPENWKHDNNFKGLTWRFAW